MVFKRPRIDSSGFLDSSLGNKIINLISSNISEIEANVRNVLALKNKEIWEKNLAFTVVAKENAKLVEDNVHKTKQLEECNNVLVEKDQKIKSLYYKTMNEIKKWRDTTEENNEKQNKLLDQKQIQLEIAENNNEHYLSENEKQQKEIDELKETVESKSKQLEDKSNKLKQVSVNLEKKLGDKG